eukprot:s538_g14.t2
MQQANLSFLAAHRVFGQRGPEGQVTCMAAFGAATNKFGTMKRRVAQQAESGPDKAKRTVSVHCLAGSSFELEHQLLLHHVQHDEIWYVVRKLGAGRVAMLWERLLQEKTVSDVAALNETMSLTWCSNQGIQLPSSLQSLTFGFAFNQSLKGIQLPSSLQSLTFGGNFNQSLEGIQLPSSLQSLTFSGNFNQSLEGIQLPSGLQSLTFGFAFNQSLKGIQLPSSLQSLTFGGHFNQSLEGIQLPSSLQSLTFGGNFNQSLEGIQLPSSLQSLTFGHGHFNQSLEGIQIPSSLQSLTFGSVFNESLEGIQLPSSLQSLTFGGHFNQSLQGIQIPSSLQSLTFGPVFNQSLEGIQLPSSLQSLTFGIHFNQSLEGIQLPSSLQSLTFGGNFNQSLEGIQLPSSLQSLTFGGNFNQSLEGIQLPSNLQSLTFGYDFNQSLEGIQLPSSLQSLTFGYDFNQSLEGIQLPSSLVAIGCKNGTVQLFRAQDLLQEKQTPVTLNAVEESLQGGQEVTSLEFLEQGSRVVLFACTSNAVCSWQVCDQNGGNQELRLLNADSTGGASAGCTCIFPGMNALLVAKADAVFAYDPQEGNMSAMPLDGEKVILKRFKSYFAVVTADSAALPAFSSTPSSMPKQTGLQSHNCQQPSCLTSQVCLARHLIYLAVTKPAMGGVYREDFAHSRWQANRFYLVSQDNEDPELLRQKARSLRALGLEPPRAHHFRRLAQRPGELQESPISRDAQVLTRLSGESRSATTGGSASPGATSVEDGVASTKYRQERLPVTVARCLS